MEIVGIEGLQEQDRLVMKVAAAIRNDFLAQSAYTEDAFCEPAKTMEIIRAIIDQYLKGLDQAAGKSD